MKSRISDLLPIVVNVPAGRCGEGVIESTEQRFILFCTVFYSDAILYKEQAWKLSEDTKENVRNDG